MPESAPPGVPGHAPVNGSQALTPEAVENVLADFRAWLREAAPSGEAPPGPDEEPPDLHTLLAQLTALRHEVNLQTRASRAQQEQNIEALRLLGDALHTLRETRAAAPEEEEQARPLLKTLVDLYDALALGQREVQRVREAVLPVLDQFATADGEPAPPRSFLARLFGGRPPEPERPREAVEAAERSRAFLDSILTGYTMSLQRLDRALREHGLEPIPCVGRPFDPEWMEVLEVVSASGRPANEVLDEVRRGYLWNGRVFRYAQVRVAKP
jgi:molecular chaperone GrpE